MIVRIKVQKDVVKSTIIVVLTIKTGGFKKYRQTDPDSFACQFIYDVYIYLMRICTGYTNEI